MNSGVHSLYNTLTGYIECNHFQIALQHVECPEGAQKLHSYVQRSVLTSQLKCVHAASPDGTTFSFPSYAYIRP